MAWYNTYRPQTFNEVIGQDLIKDVLQNSIKKNVIKHAYLFSGPKGIGKTTLARIFAKEVNNVSQNPEAELDIIEMDAASNTSVDDIRQLLESAKTNPLSAPYKIYIIDEVHMLSKSAMNALLKILEEPPEYIIFLLATTNPEKLLPTVLSRLTKLPLHNHSPEDILKQLEYIASQEQMHIDQPGLEIIAKRAEGSQRDAINLLETVHTYNLPKYSSTDVARLLGLLPEDILEKALSGIQNTLTSELVKEINKHGVDGTIFLNQLLEYAIDQSMIGNNTHDHTIIPIAEIISLKLPFTSTTAALALVHQKVSSTPKTPTPPNKKDIHPPARSVEKPKKSEVQKIPQDPRETTSRKDSIITSPDKETLKVKEEKENTQPSKSNPKNEDLTKILNTLKQDATCPPILKMIIPDIQTKKQEDGDLEISVTNGIFLAQLQSTKLQTFLAQYLESKLSQKLKLTIVQRKTSVHKIEKLENSQTEPEEKFSESDTKKTTEEEPEEEPHSTKSTKFVYKVYHQLPKELKEGELPIYKDKIPAPKKIETEEWTDVEDMFELE